MGLLALSILALAIGPVTAAFLRGRAWSPHLLEGLVLVAVSGLVLLHVLPHAVAAVGSLAVGAAAAGFAMPLAVERLSGGLAVPKGRFVWLVVATFGAHALVDGAALVEHAGSTDDRFVALVVLLHRLPDGLAIWSLVSIARGPRVAAGVLGAIGGLTALGFGVGGRVFDGPWVPLLQAFVGGSVLHIVLHGRPARAAGGPSPPMAAAAGAVLGLAVLILLAIRPGAAAAIAAGAFGLELWRARRHVPA